MNLDRRAFLKGLFGTAVLASAGQIPAGLDTIGNAEAWASAIAKAYNDYICNIMIYGTGAIRFSEKFPYVRSIPIREMTESEIARAMTINEALPQLSEFSAARELLSNELGKRAVARLLAEDQARRHTTGGL